MSLGALMCAPSNSTVPKYTRPLLDIEANFDICRIFAWHSAHWKLCIPILCLYLGIIFIGRKYMASRPPFQLRGALFFWNVALASFSVMASWRLLTTATYAIETYGFMTSICTVGPIEQRQAVGVWIYLSILSKIVQLGDTVFIVLRKKPLMFLHWYHHLTVTFMVWSTGAYATPVYGYFCLINLVEHSVMYSYYALKALGFPIPKLVSMAITLLQLVQMVAGVFLTVYAYRAEADGHPCPVPIQTVVIAGVVYFTYFLLFLDFFVRAYVFGPKSLANCKGSLMCNYSVAQPKKTLNGHYIFVENRSYPHPLGSKTETLLFGKDTRWEHTKET